MGRWAWTGVAVAGALVAGGLSACGDSKPPPEGPPPPPPRLHGALREAVGHLRTGRPDTALEVLDAALGQSLPARTLIGWRGNALVDLGRPEEAVAAFREARALPPDPEGTPHRLEVGDLRLEEALALVRLGRGGEAEQAIEEPLHPTRREDLRRRGRVRCALAEEAFFARGNAALGREQLAKVRAAEAALRAEAEKDGGAARALPCRLRLEIRVAALVDDDPARAVGAAEEHLELCRVLETEGPPEGSPGGGLVVDGKRALAAALLHLHARTGEAALLDRAELLSREALALPGEGGNRRGEVGARMNLGLVDLRRGRFAAAADQLHAALRLVTSVPGALDDRVDLLVALGHAWTGEGEFDRARQALLQAREFAGREKDAGRDGRAVLALALLDRAEGLAPSAELLAEAERLAKAVPDAALAARLAAAAKGDPVDPAAAAAALVPPLEFQVP